MPATTTRTAVLQGVAAYFGGTWVNNIRAYQGGPLVPSGVGTVRVGWGKRLNFEDFFAGQAPGRGMGCYIIVDSGHDREYRRANAGAPQSTAGSITAGGIKFIEYRLTLYGFHLAQKGYAEDAQADVDLIIEAIKQQIRLDRTLGGICTDGGETRFGIQTDKGRPMQDENGRTGVEFQITFEIRTQIIA